MKILLTTTSFQDTPGKHHELLERTGFNVDRLRGPLKEDILLGIIDKYDGVICGDDEFTELVIEKGKRARLKIISKYGVGLDKIDLKATEKHSIPVFNTPGVNQVTVAEHTLSLLLTYLKNIHKEFNITREGKWERLIGNELYGKRIGIVGLGKIGKELAKRLSVFGVEIFAFDIYFNENFNSEYGITPIYDIKNLINRCDIICLNIPLNYETKHLINEELILNHTKKNIIIVNTSRALIIEQKALLEGIKKGIIGAYLTDVLDEEPMTFDNPLLKFDNVIITPHIGSRTYESVERQGIMAVKNLLDGFKL